jgi:hypothetical protein
MKLITSIQGAAILHVSPDEVIPIGGLLIRDLLRVIGDTYQFSVKPEIPSGVPPNLMPTYVFQSGVLETEKEKVPISQLIIAGNGGAIMANTTDAADKVLDDYIRCMKHFTLATQVQRLSYCLAYAFNRLAHACIGRQQATASRRPRPRTLT